MRLFCLLLLIATASGCGDVAAEPPIGDVFGSARPVVSSDRAPSDLAVDKLTAAEPKHGPPSNCPTCRPAPMRVPTFRPIPSRPAARTVPGPGAVDTRGWVRYPGGYFGPPIKLAPGEILVDVQPLRIPAAPKAPTQPPTKAPTQPPTKTPPMPPEEIDDDGTREPREGVFSCYRCRRAVVGREWFELWGTDGTPLTFLCDECWTASNPEERQAYFRQYAERARLSTDQESIGAATVRNAAAEVRDN